MRRASVFVAAAVLLVGLGVLAPRFLTRDRDYLSVTPQPPAVEAPAFLNLPADGRACMNLVALDHRSEEARIRPAIESRPVPFDITITGEDGYQAHGRAEADYEAGDVVALSVKPPPRSLIATVCLHNDGERAVALAAVVDRRRSRSNVLVDGVPSQPGFVIQFAERQPVSLLERMPNSIGRMTVLRPGIVGEGALWVLVGLFVVGVPLATLWAFARAVRDDEPER
jgi:hypothetical protein